MEALMHSCTSYPQHGEFSLAQNLRVRVVRAAQRNKKQSSDLPLVAEKPQSGLFFEHIVQFLVRLEKCRPSCTSIHMFLQVQTWGVSLPLR